MFIYKRQQQVKGVTNEGTPFSSTTMDIEYMYFI